MRKLLKRFLHNWKIKISVFFLAFLLWFFVVHIQTYETVIDVPIQLTKLKPGKIIVSEIPKTVKVRFSGLGKDLQVIKYLSHPYLELDLHTINYFYDYPLQLSFIILPSGVHVIPESFTESDTVKVLLEDIENSVVPITAKIDLRPQSGHTRVGLVKIQPDSVIITGPRSRVRSIQCIETEERIYLNASKSISEKINLMNPHPKWITMEPSKANISFTIDKIAERTLKRVPINAEKTPSGRMAVMEPSVVDVWLRGSANLLASLTVDSVKATVSLSDWKQNQRNYPVDIVTPKDVELLRYEPQRVRIRLEVR